MPLRMTRQRRILARYTPRGSAAGGDSDRVRPAEKPPPTTATILHAPMSRRRTANIQRRPRATDAQLSRRVGAGRRLPEARLLIAGGIALLAVLGIVALVLATSAEPVGQAVREAGRGHIEDGTRPPPGSYNSVPATSGNHWGTPANWGVYPIAVPEAQVIHNLEHGGIVIWYDEERISSEDVADLTAFVERELSGARFKFILSPWDGEDFGHAIAVTAWTRLLYQDELDLDEVRAFADRYYGRLGPEPGGGPGPPR